MRVLVTGSTGFIGRHLVPRLLDEGDEVYVLRRGGGAAPVHPGASVIDGPGDLALIGGGPPWPEDLDLLIHLAALNPERGKRAAADVPALTRANAKGTAILAQRAVEAGVRRFLFLSTANVHRPNGTIPVIEEDECDPLDAYARSKLEGERLLREALTGTGSHHTILRPAPVFGPGSRGAIAMLERLAAMRWPLPFASLTARRSVLSIHNLVDAILLTRGHPAARDEVFLIADDDPPTFTDLVEMMRAARNRPSRQFPLPPSLFRTALGFSGKHEMAARLADSFVVDTAKIRLRVGWRPRLTTREALSALSAESEPRRKERA